jgi:hypothetical protein
MELTETFRYSKKAYLDSAGWRFAREPRTCCWILLCWLALGRIDFIQDDIFDAIYVSSDLPDTCPIQTLASFNSLEATAEEKRFVLNS